MRKMTKDDLKEVRVDLFSQTLFITLIIFFISLGISFIGSLLFPGNIKDLFDLNKPFTPNVSTGKYIYQMITSIFISFVSLGLSIGIIKYSLDEDREEIFTTTSVFQYISGKNIWTYIKVFFMTLFYFLPSMIILGILFAIMSVNSNVFLTIVSSIFAVAIFIYIIYISILVNLVLLLMLSGDSEVGAFETMKQCRIAVEKESLLESVKVSLKYTMIYILLFLMFIIAFVGLFNRTLAIFGFLLLSLLFAIFAFIISLYATIDTNYVLALNAYADYINYFHKNDDESDDNNDEAEDFSEKIEEDIGEAAEDASDKKEEDDFLEDEGVFNATAEEKESLIDEDAEED